jgi:excisionase family DNA binding protein
MKNVELITTAEVAARANVSVRTVTRWVNAGKLTVALKVPGQTGAMLFDASEVDALIANGAA